MSVADILYAFSHLSMFLAVNFFSLELLSTFQRFSAFPIPRFGTAKVENLLDFANFIILFFQACFSMYFPPSATSFAGCKGADYFGFCQVKHSLFFNFFLSA